MLELTIIDGIRPDNSTVKSKTFNAAGGVIGRSSHCTWVLMDRQRVVSSEHAKIIFKEGHYYLSDISTNGVLNSSGQRISKGELRKLNRGDIYIIGPYRVQVSEVKLTDPADSLKEAGLQHLLLESEVAPMLTPLEYASTSALQSEANLNFSIANKNINTLKAYDFVPEPIDLLLKNGSIQTPNPCIAEDSFTHNETSKIEAKPEERVPTHKDTTMHEPEKVDNLPVAISTNFIQELCQAFNLDYRLLIGQTQSELQQKVTDLLQGMLGLLLDLIRLEKNFINALGIIEDEPMDLHNPLKVAVSQRQLFELLMRDDPEFMKPEEALNYVRQMFLPRLQKLITHLPQAQRKLLAMLAPEAITPKVMHKFNLLQDKYAWQAYQQHYQNLASDNARAWLAQFNTFIKEN